MANRQQVPEQSVDDLLRRATEFADHACQLARMLSETAGRIAATEQDVARVHEQISRAGISITADRPMNAPVRPDDLRSRSG